MPPAFSRALCDELYCTNQLIGSLLLWTCATAANKAHSMPRDCAIVAIIETARYAFI